MTQIGPGPRLAASTPPAIPVTTQAHPGADSLRVRRMSPARKANPEAVSRPLPFSAEATNSTIGVTAAVKPNTASGRPGVNNIAAAARGTAARRLRSQRPLAQRGGGGVAQFKDRRGEQVGEGLIGADAREALLRPPRRRSAGHGVTRQVLAMGGARSAGKLRTLPSWRVRAIWRFVAPIRCSGAERRPTRPV